MSDPTETVRRELVAEINAEPGSREALEALHGQVWNTEELSRDFEVLGFMAGKSLVGYVMQEQDEQKQDEQKQKDSADSLRCRIGVLGRRQV